MVLMMWLQCVLGPIFRSGTHEDFSARREEVEVEEGESCEGMSQPSLEKRASDKVNGNGTSGVQSGQRKEDDQDGDVTVSGKGTGHNAVDRATGEVKNGGPTNS